MILDVFSHRHLHEVMENDGESFPVGFSEVIISSLNPTEEAITTKSRCVYELLKAALIGQLVLILYNPG